MSAPAMKPSALPEMKTIALNAGSCSRRVSTVENSSAKLAWSVFRGSSTTSNRTTPTPTERDRTARDVQFVPIDFANTFVPAQLGCSERVALESLHIAQDLSGKRLVHVDQIHVLEL